MKYADKLKDPRWQKKKDKILRRDNYKCRLCKKQGRLNVHHLEYLEEPWDAPDNCLITLCKECHDWEHGRGDEMRLQSDLKFLKSVISALS